jgi:hypothetical protein
MPISRKEFIQKACIAGVCMCGFGSLAMSKTDEAENSNAKQEDNQTIQQAWIAGLLKNIENNLSNSEVHKIVKSNAIVHYNNLKMDEMLANYVGDIDGFINFISEKWGWKVEHNKESKIILANENKSYCVCPMIDQNSNYKSTSMCYCSEGFAELMFSKVANKQASAEVVSSVIRGDKNCIYKITFS